MRTSIRRMLFILEEAINRVLARILPESIIRILSRIG